jgi:hypothetical protein
MLVIEACPRRAVWHGTLSELCNSTSPHFILANKKTPGPRRLRVWAGSHWQGFITSAFFQPPERLATIASGSVRPSFSNAVYTSRGARPSQGSLLGVRNNVA